MELLKDLPGYKGILKAVIQLQIKQLVDLLSDQTGDECIVLVASIPDKTLCHLGTRQGEDYLKGKDQLKREFLQHCLQKFNGEKTVKYQNKQEERSQPSPYVQNILKRRRLRKKSSGKTGKELTGKSKSRKKEEKSWTGMEIDKDKKQRMGDDSECSMIETDIENTMQDTDKDLEDNIMNDRHGFNIMGGNKDPGQKRADGSGKDGSIADLHVEDFEDLLDDDAELSEKMDHSDDNGGKGNQENSDKKFVQGKIIDPDLRTSIIFEIVKRGGDVETGFVPRGVYTKVRKMFGLPATSSVTRRWEDYLKEEIMKKENNRRINPLPDNMKTDVN